MKWLALETLYAIILYQNGYIAMCYDNNNDKGVIHTLIDGKARLQHQVRTDPKRRTHPIGEPLSTSAPGVVSLKRTTLINQSTNFD